MKRIYLKISKNKVKSGKNIKMKKIRRYLVVFFLIMSFQMVSAQDVIAIDNVKAKFMGLSYIQITNGAGIGGFYEKYFAKSHRLGVEGTFIIARGENEYPVYNYYYGYYMEKTNKKRLSFLNVNLRYKKILFVDKIANNFRPFLLASVGPVIAFDPPNVQSFSERWKNIDTKFSLNGNVGIGLDFLFQGNAGMSFFAGYNLLHFNSNLDPDPDSLKEYDGYEFDYGKKNYSSAIVKISITRKF